MRDYLEFAGEILGFVLILILIFVVVAAAIAIPAYYYEQAKCHAFQELNTEYNIIWAGFYGGCVVENTHGLFVPFDDVRFNQADVRILESK